MIAGNLIEIARGRLGDEKKQRWSDNRMLQIVSQGQANLCKLSGIYRKEAFIALANGQVRYRLPGDCMTIRRLEYQGEVIPILNRNDLDEGKTGLAPFVAIKDNIGMGLLDIYPALDDIETDIVIISGDTTDDTFILPDVYGVVTDIGGPIILEPAYGVISGLDLELDPEAPSVLFGEVCHTPEHPAPTIGFPSGGYGVTTAIEYTASEDPNLFGGIVDSELYQIVGQYGITSSVTLADNTLRVFYEAVPTKLPSFQTALVIPDLWEEGIIRYIVGTSLQDDNDANNIQRGEMELQKYVAEALKAREVASKDFSGGSKEKYQTSYRRI